MRARGELPLTPKREMTRVTGARQKGWVGVAVREGVEGGVPLGVEVEEGVSLEVEVVDGVGVDDGDGEPVPVGLAVAVVELLGVPVGVG